MSNMLFDRSKLVLTVLEDLKDQDPTETVQGHIQFIIHRLKQDSKEDDPKEIIALPRQRSYVQPTVEKRKYEKKKKNRMIWSEEKKGWILRREKKKIPALPPVIEATNKDAYEDVFRKRETQLELEKSKVKLKKVQKTIKKARLNKRR